MEGSGGSDWLRLDVTPSPTKEGAVNVAGRKTAAVTDGLGLDVTLSPSKEGTVTVAGRKTAAVSEEERVDAITEMFFQQNEVIQKKVMNRILTDPRLQSQVLPPSTRVTSHSDEHDDTAIEYNNQIVALSDPDSYEPLEHNAFHFYQPNWVLMKKTSRR